jgi:outer membrane protein
LSQTRQARANFLYADQTLEGQRRNILGNVRQAYRGLISSASEIKSLEKVVTSSQSELDATQVAYDAGTRTLVDVLNSQTALLKAKQNLASTRYTMILQYLSLKQYAGVLSASDIMDINRWLKMGT